jgi:hypothetical protein
MSPVRGALLGNSAPIAHNGSFETVVDTAQEITLYATDADGDALSFAVLTQPQHGTLSGQAPSFLYTPAPGYSGPDAFTWKVNDGTLDSAISTASITVSLRDAQTSELPRPSWYTDDLHQRVLASGKAGVEVPLGHEDDILGMVGCLGFSPPSASPVSVNAVSAGGCMVHPHGCTMNFIFRDSSGVRYIGTAGHCLEGGGDVVMQVGTRVDATDTVLVTLAKVGQVASRMDDGIGRDFGIVRIDPGWAVVPGIAGAAGPTGVFCGDPLGQPVAHYGHGYVFLVGPGQAKLGEVIPDLSLVFKGQWDTGFNWVGYGLPGDSGSGVMDGAGLAVGDLTHGLAPFNVPVPGLSFGTTMTGIFGFLGGGYKLVTVDGRGVSCPGNLLSLIGV